MALGSGVHNWEVHERQDTRPKLHSGRRSDASKGLTLLFFSHFQDAHGSRQKIGLKLPTRELHKAAPLSRLALRRPPLQRLPHHHSPPRPASAPASAGPETPRGGGAPGSGGQRAVRRADMAAAPSPAPAPPDPPAPCLLPVREATGFQTWQRHPCRGLAAVSDPQLNSVAHHGGGWRWILPGRPEEARSRRGWRRRRRKRTLTSTPDTL